MSEEDYIDSLFESQASVIQISIIEGLLIVAGITQKEKEDIDLYLPRMSEEEAYKTINYLKEYETFNDPRDQWKKWIHRL